MEGHDHCSCSPTGFANGKTSEWHNQPLRAYAIISTLFPVTVLDRQVLPPGHLCQTASITATVSLHTHQIACHVVFGACWTPGVYSNPNIEFVTLE